MVLIVAAIVVAVSNRLANKVTPREHPLVSVVRLARGTVFPALTEPQIQRTTTSRSEVGDE